ncbi:MAG: transglutaminase family protein [Solirubrobacteraceae bacterium]|nr:transglutaminase family protein [Solirubrobacteraceae bacterium]
MTARYRITHKTAYYYEADVSASYGRMRLLPREQPGQRCLESSVTIEPDPGDHSQHIDIFGNRVDYMSIHEPHRVLTITASSVVEVDAPPSLPLAGGQPWESVRDGVGHTGGEDDVTAVQFSIDSPLVGASEPFRAYAEASFPPGRPLAEAVIDLSSRIHREFEFVADATDVNTPPETVLKTRTGVCQDFAHVGIACLRSLGLPARYVSGYLETDPPPGMERLTGADVSHAWFGAFVPGAGWIDVDPTNDQVPGQRYIVTAYGRDYSDVAPVSGVIYTRGRTKSLEVVVDVLGVDPSGPTDLPTPTS